MNDATRLKDKHVIVRHPSTQGAIVAKLGNYQIVPDELLNHGDLIYQSVPSNSALTDKTIDRSGIDPDSELAQLLREHWGFEDIG